MIKNHWTISYALNKLIRLSFDFFHKDYPWITRQSTKFIEENIGVDTVGYEWGSGRSTLWFAKKTKYLYSIEHDRDWFNQVSQKISEEDIRNVKLIFKPLGEGLDEHYAKGFEDIDETPDFILVDGKLRDQCALEAIGMVRNGGFIIIDNINRYIPNKSKSPDSINYQMGHQTEMWKRFSIYTKDWETVWTSDGITDTAIFIKPSNHKTN